MRLLNDPLWRPEDLGAAIPPSPHAVSVCLPTWQDNIGYEEGHPRVVERLQAGYPRFVFHPFCRRLFEACLRRFGRDAESCLAFPTGNSARRFSDWMVRRARVEPRLVRVAGEVHAAFFPRGAASEAKSFWQHTGEGVSSRAAEAALLALGEIHSVGAVSAGLSSSGEATGREAKSALRRRLAQHAGVAPEEVYLFPCGMNAAWQLHGAVLRTFPGRRSAQFGFPYVDTLKIQEKLGPGAVFAARGDAADLDRLKDEFRSGDFSAVYTEVPSNPLLLTPDLAAIADLVSESETLLVVDDTLGACLNVDALPVADVLWVSLTKYFSGVGDATGGAVILNARSRHYARLKPAFDAEYEDLVDPADAATLEANARDCEARVRTINENAERLADALAGHPLVEAVHFPKFRTRELYRAWQRPGGGFGGLLSIDLREPERRAARFFDALRVSKGPNLGTTYTLACPYTILAHYSELDFAESCGVSRHLVRVSVGTEPAGDLIARFEEALEAAR